MQYLLDTNIIIYALKNKYPAIKKHFEKVKPSTIFIPSIVAAEIEYGCRKSSDYGKNIEKYRKFMDVFMTLPFGDAETAIYGTIRSELERKGIVIGGNEILIASIALANGCILVTNNIKEFSRIPNLKVEDWTQESV